MRLSKLLDAVGLYTHIIEESKYGKRKHPDGDPWGYTRDGVRLYAPDTDPDEVVRIFEEVGAHDDHAAARWLLKHESMIP